MSHTPHVVASPVAASLEGGDDVAPGLAGQELRDVPRIAAGDSCCGGLDVEGWRKPRNPRSNAVLVSRAGGT
ncbi:MAG TPA: hypothetical protein VM347_39825 [Nonomuraea sp.]|nr:hypothetical protein [Nonomuraea sp.]